MNSPEQTIGLMSDWMVLMERRIHMGEDRVGDVLDTPIDFREYTLVPWVPEAPVASERVLEIERRYEEVSVSIEDQSVGVALSNWTQRMEEVEVQDWT